MESGYVAWDEDSVFPSLHAPFFAEHLARYRFAAGYVDGKSVLEVACGKGYGSKALSQTAGKVTGVDLNHVSLDFARSHYSAPNIEFKEWDVTRLESLEGRYDVITAFEVIEHLPPGQTDAFLSGVRSKLAEGGVFLVSTPNHEVVTKSGSPVPEFHINNFSARELRALLFKYFPEVKLMGQVCSRGVLKDFLYWADVLHLRHHKIFRLLRHKNHAAVPVAKPENTTEPPQGELWTPEQGWGDSAKYFFSPFFWRQAGLTLAICRKV